MHATCMYMYMYILLRYMSIIYHMKSITPSPAAVAGVKVASSSMYSLIQNKKILRKKFFANYTEQVGDLKISGYVQ